jgi:Cdc6-like AAA superfamily ATPase
MTNDEIVKLLDQVILRFSDDPSGHPPAIPTTEEESVIRTFSPKNLEGPFQELYSILYPCLRPRSSSHEEATTASAILMGPRGSGKSLLVHRCLEACQQAHGSKFRKVVVNGIVVRGEDVPSVVYEIIRQLSDIALTDDAAAAPEIYDEDHQDGNEPRSDAAGKQSTKRKRKRKEDDEYLLRLRKSTFTSNLALLESTLKMAEVDRIPIVLVLDELDAFILQSKDSQQHRQLLLYHLLDRVATPGSNLALIGLTSNFTALTQMEKRIRSRAEGTSKIVYLRPPTTYDQLTTILQDKLLLQGCCPVVCSDLEKYILPSKSEDEEANRIVQTFQREFRMGRDLRWFCRVICSAVSLYRLDCMLADSSTPKLNGDYFMQALAMAGSLCLADSQATSATKQSSLCLVDGVAVDPRLQASLLDLSQSQIALLLAAKRILSREAHLEHALSGETTGVPPLTLQRMIREYQSFRRGIQSYSDDLLMTAVKQLLERGVLLPSLDHSGGGPLQYHVSSSYATLDPYSLLRLPLHFPTDLNTELDAALSQNLLNCSTALLEWGRKTN